MREQRFLEITINQCYNVHEQFLKNCELVCEMEIDSYWKALRLFNITNLTQIYLKSIWPGLMPSFYFVSNLYINL